MFEAQDGYLNINGRRDAHFQALSEVLGLARLATDPRFATVPARFEHEAELMPLLRQAVRTRTVADLVQALNAADVLNAPVHDYGDYFNTPHVRDVGAVAWIEQAGIGKIPMPRLPGFDAARAGDPRIHTPAIGEHGREVLRELDYSDAEIDALAAREAIRLPHTKP